ncbi:hypothetical protein EMIT0324P_20215 [Pseudomonas chlororaphis]
MRTGLGGESSLVTLFFYLYDDC